MHIYLRNNPVKFLRGMIWNNGALGIFWRWSPQEKQEEEQQQQQDE